MYCYKDHIVGYDENGFFVGKLIGDIIQRKHHISKTGAIKLLRKWAIKDI